jgi:hypothetical protein
LSSGRSPNECHAEANEHDGQSGPETLSERDLYEDPDTNEEAPEGQIDGFGNLHGATDRKIESASNA